MYNPISTYRIQFNKDFTFKNFKDNLEYFTQLGVGTIYASPVFKSTPGSVHGYDVTDPHVFNPEIGNEQEFDEIIEQLKKHNIGWIQDIVPNHMALHKDNQWLMDVLKKGTTSPYSNYFDINFSHPDFKGKLLIPFIGKPVKEAIAEGEIILSYIDGNWGFSYYDFFFPASEETDQELSASNQSTDEINSDPKKIEALLNQQHYQLAYWQEASQHLNYRRFFTINSLISLAMEGNEVFKDYHSFIANLVRSGKINGLRIDHVDGLKEPANYVEKLRVLTGDDIYMVVEKILQANEQVVTDWPLEGTTGYDFLGMVNNLFTFAQGYPQLRKFYQEFTSLHEDPEEIIYQKKKLILFTSKQGDLDNLCRLFEEGNFIDPKADITHEQIRNAIAEFLVCFPRYKSYSWFFPLSSEDKKIVDQVIRKAETKNPSLKRILSVLRNLFIDQQGLSDEQRESALQFYLRCMQYTGPLMAKGVEDTVMYHYNCFIAHNEVGDAVNASGLSIREFHEKMVQRQKTLPLTQNATATHDTKRGEDARARLNVISETAQDWFKAVRKWSGINDSLKQSINGKKAPSANEEYFIYQTLVGIFPFNGIAEETLLGRLDEYMIKSLREAKINSNWNQPDQEYEKAVTSFIRKILENGSPFLESFHSIQKKLAKGGIFNSFSQLFLKATCPGLPDFYQGTELWDFSLVDPDNRRPVDYRQRKSILKDLIRQHQEDPGEFYRNVYLKPENGYLKLWLTRMLIKERAMHPNLFAYGQYIPLNVTGNLKDHILAFARVYKNTWYIIIIPLYLTLLYEKQGYDFNSYYIDWEDTTIEVPELAPEKWSVIQEGTVIIPKGRILVSSIMENPFPCLLRGTKETTGRKAGILLHLSSLPGKYGTGDMGESARQFLDYLWSSGQSYWQVLPLNPVEEGSDYSPYSTLSAFAGNLLYINPDSLVNMRLVKEETLKAYLFSDSNKTDFKKAEQFRVLFLDEAYRTFKLHPKPYLQKKFDDFCRDQKFWINDYALYVQLRKNFKGQSWVEWPEEYSKRNKEALKDFSKKNFTQLEKFKFWQFLFSWQWNQLREYTNHLGIKIIGDIPFYVNYESAEVWQNPEFYKLDKNNKMKGIAGVPPDYFSEEGQLWNMPVYHWENMKKDQFTWWRNRIRRNLEFCDLIRFDHFRGFSAFWEVPSGEVTAVKGKWKPSLGLALFHKLSIDYPTMPFVAEDLGDIDEAVYKLRDTFRFPGLEVLQFAFSSDMSKSVHIPFNHKKNSIAYTGTHDNNTIKGWFKSELSREYKLLLNAYLDKVVKIGAVHLDFIRMCYNSVAFIAIIPMQDHLGLDSHARLNNPALVTGNWTWKLRPKDLSQEVMDQIRNLSKLYGRI